MRILIGTRKGLFRLERRRAGWSLDEPRFLGVQVNNAMRDPRDGSIWACLGHGHWGPKLHVSHDDMRSFAERACPAFPEGCRVERVTDSGVREEPASVRVLYTIVPAGPDGAYLVGTDPGGLFHSRDAGAHWQLNESLWRRRSRDGWMEGGGGLMLHTILVAPQDPDEIHVGVSCGGVYASADGGRSWAPRNRGVPAGHLPDPEPETGQDTHMIRQHPRQPGLLWQQNHVGNYRSTDGGRSWSDVTAGLPTRIAFGLAVHDEDPSVAWVVPMDSDDRRVAPGGALVVCRTDDGGRTWKTLREGLPQRHCYDIVLRHALDASGDTVAFGTNCGSLFLSEDRGERWHRVDATLPPVLSLAFEAARLPA